MWTEHTNPEGRIYWFHTGTRQSVWEKPEELKTAFEKALAQTKWKEYFSNNKKYYYHTETKESKWEMPPELKELSDKIEREKNATALVPTIPGQGPPIPGQGALVPAGGLNPSLSALQQNGSNGLPTSAALPGRPNLPEDPVIPHNGFATFEEGEKAFIHLLKKAGVDPSWSWEETMRTIITDPLYKALNQMAERRAAFEKHVAALRAKETEDRENRLAKLRPALRNMLKGNPNVFHYSTFASADKYFSQHPIWQQARIEAERKLIFEEYVDELKQREISESRTLRTRSIQKVMSLFKKLDIDVTTRWRDAHKQVQATDEWRQDEDLRKLPDLDVLLAFEDYYRLREREFEEQTRRTQINKNRRERKAREAFKDMLADLHADGKLKARTKWKDIYPMIKNDDHYLDLLGNAGSNPLELFWDFVDELDQKLDVKIETVEKAILKYESSKDGDGDVKMDETNARFQITVDTKERQFVNYLEEVNDAEVNRLTRDELAEVFHAKLLLVQKKQADEKKKYERRQRHLQDDLRYALKKLPEPLDISLSYEDAVPFMKDLAEFKAIDEDESRRNAFAKFVKRQKEKLRETAPSEDESLSSRKRKEPHHRDDRDRDYDREYRKRSDYDHLRNARVEIAGPHIETMTDSRYDRKGDRDSDERPEKKSRYERDDGMDIDGKRGDETPEEGEI
ncbi:hypothetical protein DL96DRAFT_1704945 [Flagelloscypha sp. PMI_526]|nr:hypothetical protein DL96DRAFT_1704945 [Flagelloscypha sp. PMI_526]